MLALALAPASQADVSPRIVHGSDAAITDFPFQVALYSSTSTPADSQFCGGVIVGVRKVITAAHCVYNVFNSEEVTAPADLSVLAGTADLTSTGGTEIPASSISFDPQYNPDTNDFDVAVITLSVPLWDGATPAIDGTNAIAPVPMMSDDAAFTDHLDAGDPAFVSGWGDTSPEPDGPPNFQPLLQSAQVPLVNQTTCENDYVDDATITHRLFCAGNGPAPITDSCQGDSGGPIVIDGESPANPPDDYVLVGLVDSGEGCAQAGFPGIYNRVSDPDLHAFLTATELPGAPLQSTPATVRGGSEPGDALVCDPGQWDNSPGYTFQFFARGSPTPLSDSAIYTITEADRGKRIYCRVKAANDGGYGFGESDSVLVPVPASPPPPTTGNNSPPPPPADTVAPRVRVTSRKCSLSYCTIKVHVTDASPSSGIAGLRATLGWTKRVKCRSKKSAAAAKTCTRQARRRLKPKAGRNGNFTILAENLFPRTRYSFSLVPFDKAGNMPHSAKVTTVRTKKRRPGQLLD